MSDQVPGQTPSSPEPPNHEPSSAPSPNPAQPAAPNPAQHAVPNPVQHAVPPVGGVTPVVAYVTPAAPPPRRSRAWMWWSLGIVLGLALIMGACALPFVMLLDDSGDSGSFGIGDSIAVIYIDGVIAGTGLAYDGYITPEAFKDQLDRADEDDSVKAIVLRVDSPGGTVAASEEIAAYVKAAKKPVVVSVGDVGASGAYMASSQADEIWAMPGSAVGSIGVITEIPNVSKLLDKVGVEFQVITAGKYKDAGSPFRPLTDEERSLIQGEIDDAYGQFIDIVAEGRKMPRAEVEKLATGWAWNGETAMELGLVDKIGTFDQAMDAAAKRGGIEGDYEITRYEDEFGDIFGSILGIEQELRRIGAALPDTGAVTRPSLPR